MALAQQLYEGISLGAEGEVGLITYMRTDSTNVAASAIGETRDYISRKVRQAVPAGGGARLHQEGKGRAGGARSDPPHLHSPRTGRHQALLNNDQYRLYNLIWQRMVVEPDGGRPLRPDHGRHRGAGNPTRLPPTCSRQRTLNSASRLPPGLHRRDGDDEEEEDLGNNPLPPLLGRGTSSACTSSSRSSTSPSRPPATPRRLWSRRSRRRESAARARTRRR